MSTYRLDFLAADGTVDAPVRDGAGDVTSRHMTTARNAAIHAALDHGKVVQVSRLVGDAAKPTLVIWPDGSAHAPAGMQTEHKDEGACLCTACRAQRAAARAERARFE